MIEPADSSSRFVLDESAPYLKNLTALWHASPQLARLIEACNSSDRFIIEASRSGWPTARHAANSKSIYLHSRFEPIIESRRLVDALPLATAGAFYCRGFGLGYAAEELFNRTGDDTLICIFESEVELLRIAFELRDLSKLIESRRVQWFWTADKGEFFSALTTKQPLVTLGFEPLTLNPSVECDPDFHAQMLAFVEEFKTYAKTNIATLVLNSRRTTENLLANIERYVSSPDLARLKDSCKGQPGIVVSAGPSLRKNKHLLKQVCDRAALIAVQTTLQPLLDLGVEPHFVTSLDYHSISTRFWEKLPRTLKTELVAEPKANRGVLDLSPGPISISGNEFLEKLLAEMNLNKTALRSGATVAHLAYYLAEHLGCDPIIFVGQDLGFSDGLCYMPGTSYEDVWEPELSPFCTLEMKQWEQIVRDRPILRRVPDYKGNPTYTEERLYTYLQHFESDFARTTTRIIDATEGGVLKRGATVMPLAEALEQFCTNAQPITRVPHPGDDGIRLPQCVQTLQLRLDEAVEIELASVETLPLLEELRDNIEDQKRVNGIIAKLDALRAKVAKRERTYQLVVQLTQQSELARFRADQQISSAKAEGIEKQKLQVSRDIENVRSVITAAKEFQTWIQSTIDRIAGDQQQTRAAA